MRRKEAKVSWKALMSQVDSFTVMCKLPASEGIAEYSDELLNESRNSARQKRLRRKYRLAAE